MADEVISSDLQQVAPEAMQAWRKANYLDRTDQGSPLQPGYVRTESFRPPGEAADKAATEYEAASKERQKYEKDYFSAQERRAQRVEEYQRTHPIPQPPSLQKVGPPPDAQQYRQNSMAFMAALTAVVAFSNRKSGASATDSLNAFGAAMKGWGEGNEQAYQNAAQKWKQATEATIQNNQTALQAYDLIIKNRALNTGEMLKQMEVAASLHNDHIMYNKARQEDILGVFKLRDMQERATQDLDAKSRPFLQSFNEQEAKNKLQAQELAPIVANDFRDPNGQEYVKPDGRPLTDYDKTWAKWMVETYGPGSAIGGGGGAVDQTAARRTAELMYEGKIAPLSAWSLQRPQGQAVSAHLKAIERERGAPYDPTKFSSSQARAKLEATGELRGTIAALTDQKKMLSAIRPFAATANNVGDVLLKLAEKVDSTGSPAIERWIRAGRQNIAGDVDVNNFAAQLRLYSTDIARVVTQPRLVGQLTDAARHEVERFTPAGVTYEQLKGLIPLLKRDGAFRENEIKKEVARLRAELHGAPEPPDEEVAPASTTGGGGVLQYDAQGNRIK